MWGGRIKTTSKSRAVAIKTEKKKKKKPFLFEYFILKHDKLLQSVFTSTFVCSTRLCEACRNVFWFATH